MITFQPTPRPSEREAVRTGMDPSGSCFNPPPAHVSGEASKACRLLSSERFQPTPRPGERGGHLAADAEQLARSFQPTPRPRERRGSGPL